MQQLSGSSGRGGTHTPAINVDFFWISDRRSSGEDSLEENSIEGSGVAFEAVTLIGGVEDGDAVVGGTLAMVGVEDSSIEA